jgi:hypothetical protein
VGPVVELEGKAHWWRDETVVGGGCIRAGKGGLVVIYLLLGAIDSDLALQADLARAVFLKARRVVLYVSTPATCSKLVLVVHDV